MPTPTANAKVMFKRGIQSNLDSLKSSLEAPNSTVTIPEGTFYLTTDTNRLYFAQTTKDLVELNQYIHIDELVTLSNLPNKSTSGYENLHDGDIYYWSTPNVLAIWDNTDNKWTQLNTDTVLSASSNALVVSSSSGSIEIGLLVKDSQNHLATGSFTLKGSGATTVTNNNNEITISSTDTNVDTQYSLSSTSTANSNSATINLTPGGTYKDTNAASSSVTLIGGDGVSLERDNSNGSITISSGGGVNSISNSFSTNTTGNDVGAFVTQLSVVGSTKTSSPIYPTIVYGDNRDQTARFIGANDSSGIANATLDVYTKSEVDTKILNQLQTFDAMEYAGVLNPDAAASKLITGAESRTLKIGQTYKAGGTILQGEAPNALPIDQDAKLGDLIIATGSNGNVTGWQVVPSGNDLTIIGNVADNSMLILDGSTTLAGITVLGSAPVNNAAITATPSIGSNHVNTITIEHGNAVNTRGTDVAFPSTATVTLAYNTTVNVPIITSIKRDLGGHITDIGTGLYSFKDTHNAIYTMSFGANTVNNTAGISLLITDTDGTPKSSGFEITSQTLTISTATVESVPTITAELEWGTFGDRLVPNS